MPLPVENVHVVLYVVGSPCSDLGLSFRVIRSILALAVLVPVLSNRVSEPIICINRDTSAVTAVCLVNSGTERLGQWMSPFSYLLTDILASIQQDFLIKSFPLTFSY
jgi:hypothetical protein